VSGPAVINRHQENGKENIALNSLTCDYVDDMVEGTWFNTSDGITWRQPAKCFILTYPPTAAKYVLTHSKATFISTETFTGVYQNLCESFTNLSECGEAFPRMSSFGPSGVRPSQEAGKFLIFAASPDELSSPQIRQSLVELVRKQGVHVIVLIENCGTHLHAVSHTSKALGFWAPTGLNSSGGIHIVDVSKLTPLCMKNLPARELNIAEHVISQILLNILDTERIRMSTFCALKTPGSCSLVSTAGYLLNFTNGKMIDSTDFVVRSGGGPVEGYEEHVGSRTDLRILRHSNFQEKRYRGTAASIVGSNAEIVVDLDKVESHLSPLSPTFLYTQRQALLSRSVPYLSYHHKEYTASRNMSSRFASCLDTKRDMSSGIRALSALLESFSFCQTVRAFGFFGHEFLDTQYHYYDDGLGPKTTSDQYESRANTGGHAFSAEQACISRLARESDVARDHLLFHKQDFL